VGERSVVEADGKVLGVHHEMSFGLRRQMYGLSRQLEDAPICSSVHAVLVELHVSRLLRSQKTPW
jgi:hypothetical protein